MKRLGFGFSLVTILLFIPLSSSAQGERLLLVGGGPRPAEAVARLIQWAGGKDSRPLVIGWASEAPDEAFNGNREDFERLGVHDIRASLNPPVTATEKSELLKQLRDATMVWFCGGDQKRIMAVLKDRVLADAIRSRYHSGMPVGGTSAGTAIQSVQMIAGDPKTPGSLAPLEEGLGLLPEDIIVDQHFFHRSREERLLPLIAAHPGMLGVGIDQGAAVAVTEGRFLEVVGDHGVFVTDSTSSRTLGTAQKFDLLTRQLIQYFTPHP